eukprot:TRINITY_DN5510_c0_g1_i1.p1 TRINITY_DN5510_c0_g1~~TRINITY_DN5510_c0_g1_i1.p1  ORF type:complete len:948 (+),score=234.56 TRINITY_DN5510_c0_g1_i1:32-2875(+)
MMHVRQLAVAMYVLAVLAAQGSASCVPALPPPELVVYVDAGGAGGTCAGNETQPCASVCMGMQRLLALAGNGGGEADENVHLQLSIAAGRYEEACEESFTLPANVISLAMVGGGEAHVHSAQEASRASGVVMAAPQDAFTSRLLSILALGDDTTVFVGGISFLGALPAGGQQSIGCVAAQAADVVVSDASFEGCAVGSEEHEDVGGALRLALSGTACLEHVSFLDCAAESGGAVFVDTLFQAAGNSSARAFDKLVVEDATFERCTAETTDDNEEVGGGGLLVRNGDEVSLTGVQAVECSANNGAAVLALNVRALTANACVLRDCSAVMQQIDNTSGGGAVTVHGAENVAVNGSTFEGNDGGRGGGLHISGRSLVAHSVLDLTHSNFTSNTAYTGGGCFVNVSAAHVEDCVFVANEVQRDGGGLVLDVLNDARVERCDFTQNACASGSYGGGVMAQGGLGLAVRPRLNVSGVRVVGNRMGDNTGTGAGFFSTRLDVHAIDCVVAWNVASSREGICASCGASGMTVREGSLELLDSTLSDNEKGSALVIAALDDPPTASAAPLSFHLARSTIRDTSGGAAGSGVSVRSSVPYALSIQECTIRNNRVMLEYNFDQGGSGGGLNVHDDIEDASITIEDTLFDFNSAPNAGAASIHSLAPALLFRNVTMRENAALPHSGGSVASLQLEAASVKPTAWSVEDTLFEDELGRTSWLRFEGWSNATLTLSGTRFSGKLFSVVTPHVVDVVSRTFDAANSDAGYGAAVVNLKEVVVNKKVSGMLVDCEARNSCYGDGSCSPLVAPFVNVHSTQVQHALQMNMTGPGCAGNVNPQQAVCDVELEDLGTCAASVARDGASAGVCAGCPDESCAYRVDKDGSASDCTCLVPPEGFECPAEETKSDDSSSSESVLTLVVLFFAGFLVGLVGSFVLVVGILYFTKVKRKGQGEYEVINTVE